MTGKGMTFHRGEADVRTSPVRIRAGRNLRASGGGEVGRRVFGELGVLVVGALHFEIVEQNGGRDHGGGTAPSRLLTSGSLPTATRSLRRRAYRVRRIRRHARVPGGRRSRIRDRAGAVVVPPPRFRRSSRRACLRPCACRSAWPSFRPGESGCFDLHDQIADLRHGATGPAAARPWPFDSGKSRMGSRPSEIIRRAAVLDTSTGCARTPSSSAS